MYLNRHAKKIIEELSAQFPAVMVLGARQTGKTTLLKNITEGKGIQYVTFDDASQELSTKTDINGFLEFHPVPFMFDEIQYVPELFRGIKVKIDSDRHNGMYFLTGSQQFSLMQKATETLAGRVALVQLYGLSAREVRKDSFDFPFIPTREYILQRSAWFAANKDRQNVWNQIFTGGFPEVVTGSVSQKNFYPNYLRTYIERDIRTLSNISDELAFLKFIGVVASRTGQMLNYDDIAKECSISAVTAKKWISLLVTSGLVYLLQPYSANIEKRIVKTPKMYFMDTGLAANLTSWTNADVIRSGAMAGAFFETYVISEIVKSFTNQGQTPPLYFYRDKDKIEIDLMIVKDGKLLPVEIKKTYSPSKDDARNFHILQRINGIDVQNGTIVCNCQSPVIVKENVTAIPVEFV